MSMCYGRYRSWSNDSHKIMDSKHTLGDEISKYNGEVGGFCLAK